VLEKLHRADFVPNLLAVAQITVMAKNHGDCDSAIFFWQL